MPTVEDQGALLNGPQSLKDMGSMNFFNENNDLPVICKEADSGHIVYDGFPVGSFPQHPFFL